MGCTYYIGGQEFTEKEFKKHLAGELDNYVKKGLVDLTKIKTIKNEKNKGSNVREIQKNGQGNAQNEGGQQNGKNDGQETNVQEEKVVQGEATPQPTALSGVKSMAKVGSGVGGDVESTAKIPTTINEIVGLSYDPKENITAEESKRLKSKLGTLAEMALSNNKKEKWGILAAKGSVTNLHSSIKSLLFDINKLSKTKLTPQQFEEIATKYAESKGDYLHTQKAAEQSLPTQEEKVVQGEATPQPTAQQTNETTTFKTTENEGKQTSSESKKGGGSKNTSPSTPQSKAKKIIGKTQKNLTNVQEALQKELYTPYELAIKYFLEGGKISVSGLQKIFGNKRGKSIEGEKRARISLLSKGDSNSESIGEYIYGEYTKSNNGQGELYDDSDFRSAVEEVLNDFTSVSQMANHINDSYKSKQEKDINDFDPNQPQFTYEAEHIFDVLDENEINELLEGANSKELATQIAEQWLDSEEGKQEMAVKLKAEQEIHKKSVKSIMAEIETAKEVYNKAQFKYEKLRAEFNKNKEQDQIDIFGNAPSEKILVKNDLSEQQRIIDNAREEAKGAEKILNEKEAEFERIKDNAPNAKKIEFKDAVTKAGEAIIKILDPREGIRGEGEQKAGIAGSVRSLVEGAVKAIHKAIDAGAELKDAIKEGVKYVKGRKANKNIISTIEEKLNNVAEEQTKEQEQEQVQVQASPEKVPLSEELQKIKDGFVNFIKNKTSGLGDAEVQKAIDNLFSKYETNKDFIQELKDNNLSLNDYKKEVENELITQPNINEQQNATNNTEGQVQEVNQPSGSQEYQGTQNVNQTPPTEANRGDSGSSSKEKEVTPINEQIANIGNTAEQVSSDAVTHRKDTGFQIVTGEDKMKTDIALNAKDAEVVLMDLKDTYGKNYLTKAIEAYMDYASTIGAGKKQLSSLASFGIAIENEIKKLQDGTIENTYNLNHRDLEMALRKIQPLNAELAQSVSASLNVQKTLYSIFDESDAAKELMTTKEEEESKNIQGVLENKDGQLDAAAEEHEQAPQEEQKPPAKPAKDTRKTKKISAKDKAESKQKKSEILKELKEQIKKLNC